MTSSFKMGHIVTVLLCLHIADQSAITIKNIKPTVILILIADWSAIFRMKFKIFSVTFGVTDARRHTNRQLLQGTRTSYFPSTCGKVWDHPPFRQKPYHIHRTTYKAHKKKEKISRPNQFGQNATIFYRKQLFRLDPQFSGLCLLLFHR